MIVLGQDRLDVRRERREVTLVEDRLDELFPRTRLKQCARKKRAPHTYISLQILVPRVRLHADEIAQHAGHDVVTENDDFLPEELETAWVARQMKLGNLRSQAARERGEQGLPGK